MSRAVTPIVPVEPSRVGARWVGIGLIALTCLGAPRPAGAGEEPPAPVRVVPDRVSLRGPDSGQQLLVEVAGPDALTLDATTQATYSSSDESVVRVESGGLILPEGDGKAEVTVRIGSNELVVPVEVTAFSNPPPIHFANQVVPIFTKLGCNAGGCHGKASGQNGFRLSLLGFEPELDYETLVKEGRGRRLFPTAPDRSLLLTKAIAEVPHGGGRRLEKTSHEYRLIRRWIAEGMPPGAADEPRVERIEVYPKGRIIGRGGRQQVITTAIYTDGRTEDVTRWAQYQSNDAEVAAVQEGGLVESRELSGQAAIMARYQGQIAVFRATVPLSPTTLAAAPPEFPTDNPIDALSLKQWKALGIVPSETCTDAEFIRRASLDICGTLPTGEQTRAFVEDADPAKRARLVDRLLERPEYASYFAIKWADILRNKREGKPDYQRGTFTFHDWIREQLARNTPYDRFVRDILAASGTPESAPPVQWFRKLRAADAFVDDTAQVFLGMRLQCAKCHHHPFEVWSQDDYYGFAAYFGRIGRKPWKSVGGRGSGEVIYTAAAGSVSHPKSGKVMDPKGLGSEVVPIEAGQDPRQKLVDWMANPDNPFFARALVNRYWAHFFGRGIAEPLDDLRVSNPPSNPELLDALAEGFVRGGYDLKGLIRTICNSRVYGLSSIPNETNLKDKQSFARRYPKRLTAEVLLDAISQVTAVPTAFSGLPAGTRAIDLPDEAITTGFLDAFGRPKRDTACECERVTDASLGQSLMLLNSGEVQGKLASAEGRAAALAKDTRPHEQKIAELFWAAYGRAPSSSETASALAHIQSRADRPVEAYEDILWALVNAKEFQFND